MKLIKKGGDYVAQFQLIWNFDLLFGFVVISCMQRALLMTTTKTDAIRAAADARLLVRFQTLAEAVSDI